MRTTLEIGDSGLALGGLEWKDKCDRGKKKGKKTSVLQLSSHIQHPEIKPCESRGL